MSRANALAVDNSAERDYHSGRMVRERTASPLPEPDKFEFNEKQLEAAVVMADPLARHTALFGGGRSGKTFMAIYAMFARAFMFPGSQHLSLRQHRVHAEAYLWKQTMPKVARLCFPGVSFDFNNSKLIVTLPNKSAIWFAGLDQGDSGEGVLGSEWNTIHFDEATEMLHSQMQLARTRLAAKVYSADRKRLCINRSFATLNPTYKTHHIYRTYIEKFDIDKGMPMEPEIARRYNWHRLNPVDNLKNIDPELIEELKSLSEEKKKRFLYGEWAEESKDALFKAANLNNYRVTSHAEVSALKLDKIIVGVDPAGSAGNKADMTGIVVVGWQRPSLNDRRSSGSYYILDDRSIRGTPDEWAQAVYDAYVDWKADMVVGERNFGGDLVEKNIRSVSRTIPFESVWSSRGKVLRAQPVVALSEKHDLHICMSLPELEAEMTGWNPDSGERSPNRLDAMVFGITKCMKGGLKEARMWGAI